MNKNFLIAILAIIVIGAGAYFVINRNSSKNTETMMQDSENQQMDTNEDKTMQKEDTNETNEDSGTPAATTAMEQGAVKEFTIVAKPFTFTPNVMTVKKGDTVKITLDNQQGTHNFMLDEFNAASKTLNAGEKETVEFVADKAGTFEYYCGIGNHRAMGMVGTLTVE